MAGNQSLNARVRNPNEPVPQPNLEETIQFLSDLTGARSVNRRPNRMKNKFYIIVIAIAVVCAFITAYCLALARYTGLSPAPKREFYRFASVAADGGICSEVGTAMLARGGSAVDAAIGATICGSVVNMQSAGIGGGFHMVIWDGATRTAFTLDAREVAPSAFTEEVIKSQTRDSLFNWASSIAVPGEVAGYWAAHQRFGRLPWKSLFQPAINLCRNGFEAPESLTQSIIGCDTFHESRLNDSFYDNYKEMTRKPNTDLWYQVGDTMYCKKLADTFEIIAEKGASEFYNGSLADSIIEDLTEAKSYISKEDLKNYRPIWREPLVVELEDGKKIYGMRPPGSGAVLGFILKILEGYNFTKSDLDKPLIYHRILEAIKFAYAKRAYLGDESFVMDSDKLISELTSADFAKQIRLMINDSTTLPSEMYDKNVLSKEEDFGTSQVSVLAGDGSAVSVTSTINMVFGSGLVGTKTGIIFNNEMADFFLEAQKSSFGPPPTNANFIKPGKRPMSSMSPTVVVNNLSPLDANVAVDRDNSVRLVVGAAGGSRITAAVAYVAARVLLFGENIKQAIEAPRIFPQRNPEKILYESGFSKDVINYLRDLGHTNFVESVLRTRTVVQGVEKGQDGIIGVSDARKPGLYADGF